MRKKIKIGDPDGALLFDIMQYAEEQLEIYGLKEEGWVFVWDTKAIKRYGQCRYRKREIGITQKLALINDFERTQDVVLHEIAHALVGAGHGHNQVWKDKCVEIGANPQQYYYSKEQGGDVETFKPNYVLINKDTGKVHKKYYRKPSIKDWSDRWIIGQKEKTKGKLIVIPFAQLSEYGKLPSNMNDKKMTKVDFFFKAYKKIRPFNNYEARLDVPEEMLDGIKDDPISVLENLLHYGLEQKAFGKGCYIAGVYQVQTSAGIFSRKDGKEVRLIDWNKGCSPKLVKFESWEDLEEKEETQKIEDPVEDIIEDIVEEIEEDLIHPKDLQMWAKHSYPKFKSALEEYEKVINKGEKASIVWGKDGKILIKTNE